MLKKNSAIFHYYYNNNLLFIFFRKKTAYSFNLKDMKIKSASDIIRLANSEFYHFYDKTATKKEFKDIINTFDILVLAVKYTINNEHIGVANISKSLFQHIPQLVLFSSLNDELYYYKLKMNIYVLDSKYDNINLLSLNDDINFEVKNSNKLMILGAKKNIPCYDAVEYKINPEYRKYVEMYKKNIFNTGLFNHALFGYKKYLHEIRNDLKKDTLFVYNFIL